MVDEVRAGSAVHMLVWNDFLNDARVLKEAETLQLSGYKVVVHAVHYPGKTLSHQVLNTGITVRRAPLSPFAVRRNGSHEIQHKTPLALQLCMRLWAHLVMLLRLSIARPDIIHAHDVNMLPTAWLAAKLSGARMVYDAHEISTSREGYSRVRKLVGWIERTLMPRVQGTITTTEARAKYFARAYGVARPVVLQNRPREQQAMRSDRIRAELELAQPWPIILYQGGVQQGRGLERLARVAAEVPNSYFVFIGGGRLDGSLRRIVEELQLEQRVRFIPTVALAELPSYTASADIGVQPIENTCLNHYTTDSNKLFEYVQAGLPVVASDLPEIRRVVREHDLGVLVPEGDSVALAMALRDLVEVEGKRQYYAAQSRKAASVLNWESQEHELLALYERVLSNRAST
ncbi:glycosyltransferase family 4 protein [Stutzerimonas xanthomarina]|uniref:Glycosyltransferase involved in cell wall bisynthesis n=2 Tax=Stutzerimonas xanthomarina TaxID=271420 RepID=A0A1M5KLQ5_9GAMM|nr:glycosyltransferase family 4 protein [Stutzerimonas xanthomarina]MCP9337190.1 glycosyltransferase family 4 protein [Stutzerimonas xanthomarina]SEI07202.1 Glycosyltransferase involved in cell wall bisynthesis [Stutzerimonas xanthomarina]SHG53737.1 Glycosyltransferase involved in cell wall bisynthesis [Stutzerimonas xanthomarina DSM 18231]